MSENKKSCGKMQFDFSDKRRVVLVFVAVVLMGFSLSFLNRTHFGGDPFTYMNLGISSKLRPILGSWLTLGTWQAFFNILLLVYILFVDRSKLGIGTIANMFLVGYSIDFFTWIENTLWGADFVSDFTMEVIVAVPSLALFIVVAALYMCCGLGVAPYDGLVYIIHEKINKATGKEFSFRTIRMSYDITACIFGFLLGGFYIGPVTVCVALFLGPVINWMNEVIKKILD